ncbi:MAG TPA: AsmA family protein [Usitatibacter sp.]|nr:AsmA family protein [Usitatibacter sp.]
MREQSSPPDPQDIGETNVRLCVSEQSQHTSIAWATTPLSAALPEPRNHFGVVGGMATPRKIALIVLVVLLLPVLLFGAAILVAQSEWGERKLESIVAAKLDRKVEIDGISLKWGWPPGVIFGRLRISNPEWAKSPDLIDAEGLYARVAVLPLFTGRIVVQYLGARRANAGLEMDGERATWRFGKESQEQSRLILTRVYLDDGHILFRDAAEKTDIAIDAKGSAGEGGELRATAKGAFRGEQLTATARIPELSTQHEAPLRFEGNAKVGRTTATANGVLATDGSSLDFDLKLAGPTFKELSKITGVVLPDSPPYQLAGHLKHAGNDWTFDPFTGKVGDSDLAGSVVYAKGTRRPTLRANLKSKLLDFDDLGPLIGAPPKTGPGETAAPEQRAKAAQAAASTRVLPDIKFGTDAWAKMDADVQLTAVKVQRPKQLPIDSLATHLVLKDSVMRLQPLNFGMAGGRFTTDITLDGHAKPMRGVVKGDVQGLKLKELFPTVKTMEEAVGTLYGRVDVTGHGASVAELFGTSNGQASFAVEGGRISALLVELLGLDVAEAVMMLGAKHAKVELRCAVAGFNVKDGRMAADPFVVDTSDTVIKVEGAIDLKNEQYDIETKPEPKDPSPLALRTPLLIKGPLKKPSVRPKAGPLAARIAGAAALAAINPALAVLALIETGPGKDADCGKLIAEAHGKGAVKKSQ